jgi:hypothetical protein
MQFNTGILLYICSALGNIALAQIVSVASDPVQVELGRQIYEEGILPNKQPLRGQRASGLRLEGSSAACVTCHRRSGMGSVEGSLDKTVLVPPIMGQILFAPARFAGNFLDPSHHYIPNESWRRALTRPAYTPESFTRALREGVDPAGKPLVTPMLRYDLDDSASAALIAYLQQLSKSPAPGVTVNTLHIATITTPDAAPEETDAVLGVIQAWSASSRTAGKSVQLHLWELSGQADTWAEQLANYNHKQAVFAVVSGIGAANWLPVHQFCETRRIPCVLPSLEIAPEENTSYYSVYFSPGVTLEARLLARHIQATTTASDGALVQIYSDATGLRAAKELRQAQHAVFDPRYNRRIRVTAPTAALRDINNSAQLMLWLRPAEIEQLIKAWPQHPPAERIFLSALLAPPGAITLPPEWQARIAYVSLFDDLGVQGQIAKIRLGQWLDWHNLPHSKNLRLQADAYSACYLFNTALAEIRSQEVRRAAIPLSREHLLETLETLVSKYDDGTKLVNPDSHVAYYGHMSLGPTQRMAVRGGAVFRYGSANSDQLVPLSERLVP